MMRKTLVALAALIVVGGAEAETLIVIKAGHYVSRGTNTQIRLGVVQ